MLDAEGETADAELLDGRDETSIGWDGQLKFSLGVGLERYFELRAKTHRATAVGDLPGFDFGAGDGLTLCVDDLEIIGPPDRRLFLIGRGFVVSGLFGCRLFEFRLL